MNHEPVSHDDKELRAFVAEVRSEVDAALARRATVDPESLSFRSPPRVQEQRQRWEDLRALTKDEAMMLHLAASEQAGRDVTQAEARALLGRQ